MFRRPSSSGLPLRRSGREERPGQPSRLDQPQCGSVSTKVTGGAWKTSNYLYNHALQLEPFLRLR